MATHETAVDVGAESPLERPRWLSAVARIPLLTDREREVATLLGAGLSNRAISGSLNISERTTKAHVAGIMRKLGVESRLQAGLVAFAYQQWTKEQ
ncbi:response regulator transcription factor [Micromonospora rosaria]|uniref:response regulator transcription factor n=1 Tax=Micromonospora rosaria TaxID=47874 RepID=UPI001471EAEE|nr:helix-turn-helix transcriptional regulator [Micromonospora rosaria]